MFRSGKLGNNLFKKTSIYSGHAMVINIDREEIKSYSELIIDKLF